MTPYEQKGMSFRFATYLIDHPRQSILAALVLMALLIPGIAYMKSDFSYRVWFRESDPLLAEFDAFERRFGNDETVAIVVHSPSGIFDEASANLLLEMTEAFWKVPEVIRVDSLSNYNWTHAEGDDLMVEPLIPDDQVLTQALLDERKEVALSHEVIPGYLISKDGTAATIFAQLKPAINGTPDFETVVQATRETVKTFEGRGDHEFFITGTAAVSNAFKEVTQEDMKVMVPALLAAIVIFLLLSFRSLGGVMLPMVIIFCSIAMSLGFAGWVGIPFNNLTAIVPHILIAISVADAVHILVTFFQFRRSGLDRRESTLRTLTKNLQPTLLTSVSTAIGFFSFASADLMPIVSMGILAGTGTIIAWLITIFFITPLLIYLKLPVPGGKAKVRNDECHPLAMRYANWLSRYRYGVLGFFAVLLVLSLYLGLQNEINSDPFKYFAEDVPTRIANEFAESKIGGMSGFEITIDSGQAEGVKDPAFLAKVEAFQKWIDDQDHVSKTIAITDILKQTNRALNGDDPEAYRIPDNRDLVAQELFLYTLSLPANMDLNNRKSLDNRLLRLTAMSSIHDSRSTLKEIDRIENKARDIGLDASVSGKMPLYQNMNPYVVKAFFTSISLAVLLVGIMMILVLRSVGLGLLSMVPNTVPLVLGGAFMFLLGKALDIGTVLVTATCLGIAVDDTIHFLSNYSRWRKLGVSREEAIGQVLTHTGPALFVTTMILVVAFATFAFASFVPNINFGIVTAIVLSSALICDGTLLPALLLLKRE